MPQPLYESAPQTLIIGVDGADAYLNRLGIAADAVRTAIERGEARAVETTGPEYPPTGSGLSRWIETVGVIRRQLMDSDWKVENPQNRPICVTRDRSISLGILGGTVDTGNADSTTDPKAQRRKGPATDAALNIQLSLDLPLAAAGTSAAVDVNDPPPSGPWLVVYHRGEEGVQAEVSRPSGSTDGQVDGWIVRVLLPTFTPDSVRVLPDDVGGGDVGFDVTPVAS